MGQWNSPESALTVLHEEMYIYMSVCVCVCVCLFSLNGNVVQLLCLWVLVLLLMLLVQTGSVCDNRNSHSMSSFCMYTHRKTLF